MRGNSQTPQKYGIGQSQSERAASRILKHLTQLRNDLRFNLFLSYMSKFKPASRLQQLTEQVAKMGGEEIAQKFETLQLHAGTRSPSPVAILTSTTLADCRAM